MDHNPQAGDDPDPLDIHGDDEDELSELNIFMGHLPMLRKLGIIEWEEGSEEIVKGPEWDEFEPLLRLIRENKDKLPQEWFGEEKQP